MFIYFIYIFVIRVLEILVAVWLPAAVILVTVMNFRFRNISDFFINLKKNFEHTRM